MCGHDGHTTCLLGGASLILENLDKIPSNRGIRLIFQPGEEGSRGAHWMVQEGAMQGVDEVYGLHNMPYNELAEQKKICLKVGPMMAGASKISITILGKGGHGSQPEACRNPLPIACEVYLE